MFWCNVTTAREVKQLAFGPMRMGLWASTRLEGLHFFAHGIVIRTASRTGDAVCRCEKLRRGRLGTRCSSEPRRHAAGVAWDLWPYSRGREVIARQRPLLLPERRWLGLAALLLTAACWPVGRSRHADAPCRRMARVRGHVDCQQARAGRCAWVRSTAGHVSQDRVG